MTNSLAFDKSIELVLRVHQLMVVGSGESAEANRLRADSEKPWYAMNDEEQSLVDGLSEDLYAIGKSWELAKDSDIDFVGLFKHAQMTGTWNDFLTQMRNHQNEFPPHQAAFVRGLAWLNIGQPRVSLEFFNEAVRLSPDELQYVRCLLCTLNYEGLGSQSIPLVDRIVRESQDSLSMLHAAMVLVHRAIDVPTAMKELLELAAQTMERAFALTGDASMDDLLLRELIRSHLWLACYFGMLGDEQQARLEVEQARRLGAGIFEIEEVEKHLQVTFRSNLAEQAAVPHSKSKDKIQVRLSNLTYGPINRLWSQGYAQRLPSYSHSMN